jgi:serine/threonine protein kinase
MVNIIVANEYRLTNCIGKGSCGKIYEGNHLHTHTQVAVKISQNSLRHEHEIYTQLRDLTGIPKCFQYGNEGKFDYLVMELCGQSLNVLRTQHEFSLKTILMIGIQLLKRLEDVHMRGVIHGDLKPSNILIGRHEENHKIYLMDFGLSQTILPPQTSANCATEFIGTVQYASIRAHKYAAPTRWHDLESFAYVLLYLYVGKLPWEEVKHEDLNIRQRIVCEMKQSFNFWSLQVPGEFILIINYCKQGQPDDMPSYVYLKTLLLNLYKLKGYEVDNITEWSGQFQSQKLATLL